MRDVDDGRSDAGMQRLDVLAHPDAQARIEIRERLIKQKHLGIAHHGPAQGHTLLLAARQFLG